MLPIENQPGREGGLSLLYVDEATIATFQRATVARENPLRLSTANRELRYRHGKVVVGVEEANKISLSARDLESNYRFRTV